VFYVIDLFGTAVFAVRLGAIRWHWGLPAVPLLRQGED